MHPASCHHGREAQRADSEVSLGRSAADAATAWPPGCCVCTSRRNLGWPAARASEPRAGPA
eukprot:11208373-Lingulodinium_polyedra.AAC.1